MPTRAEKIAEIKRFQKIAEIRQLQTQQTMPPQEVVAQPAPPPVQAAPPPESMGMGETLKSAATNLPGSLGQLAVDVTAPIHSPIQTGKGLYALATGLVNKLMPGSHPNEQAVDAMGNFLKDRYGSMGGHQENPV